MSHTTTSPDGLYVPAVDDDPTSWGPGVSDNFVKIQSALNTRSLSSVLASLKNPVGLTTTGLIPGWRATGARTASKLWIWVDAPGATSVTVNARNDADDLLASDAVITDKAQWVDAGTLQHTAISTGAAIRFEIVSTTGSPTEIAFQLDVTNP